MKPNIAHAVERKSDETRRDPDASTDMRDFAKELRALGQALEKFQFSDFDLELQSGLYVVTGRAVTTERIKFTCSRFLRDLFHGTMPRTTLTYSQNQM